MFSSSDTNGIMTPLYGQDWFWRASRTTTMALIGVWSVVNSLGGERIQFPTQKATILPQTQNKLAKDKLSALERAPSANPYDVIVSPGALNSSVPRRDPKEEKRLEKARLEKENWMILDQGELQEQDDQESAFGLRDYSLEEEKSAGDLWFGPKEADTKGSTRARGPNPISRNPSQGRLPSNPGEGQVARRFENNAIQRSAPQEGDHTSRELTTRIMVGESATRPSRDFFGSGPSIRSFDDQNRSGSDFGLRSLESSPTRSSLGRGLGLRELNPAASPSRIEPSASPSKSGLGLSPGSQYQGPSGVTLAPRSSPVPPTQPRNDMAPTATRDLFAPPPRPGSFGNR
jgi:hypothetical protein